MTSSPERGGLPGLTEIAAEIQALRKNRAFSGDVSEKIGPVLLELAGGDARKANERLSREVRALAGRLPGEMRTAILAALALHEDTRGMTTYSQRKRWLADTKLDRGDRTAERRIEEAQRLLAQEIAAEIERRRGHSDAADDWYIDHFSAVFMLDGDAPEAIEHRRIVATRQHLTEITIVLDTPRESGQRRLGLKADVTRGGTLLRTEELSRNRTRYIIGLPRPLQPDETHEYEMHIRVAPDEPMRDYYVFRPERRCDGFDLRVRFDRRQPPVWVRQVVGEDVHVYYPYEGVPTAAERVPVDGTGEARAAFPRLRQHLGYGLQWSFTEDQPQLPPAGSLDNPRIFAQSFRSGVAEDQAAHLQVQLLRIGKKPDLEYASPGPRPPQPERSVTRQPAGRRTDKGHLARRAERNFCWVAIPPPAENEDPLRRNDDIGVPPCRGAVQQETRAGNDEDGENAERPGAPGHRAGGVQRVIGHVSRERQGPENRQDRMSAHGDGLDLARVQAPRDRSWCRLDGYHSYAQAFILLPEQESPDSRRERIRLPRCF